MSAVISDPRAPRSHVRVWFGNHVVAQHIADPALAERYAAAMGRRFASLRITIDPIPTTPSLSRGAQARDVGPRRPGLAAMDGDR